MICTHLLGICAAIPVAAVAAGTSAAATLDAADSASPAPLVALPETAPIEFKLDTEMVVHDWVLCVSESSAEATVRARAQGVAEALAVYDGLKAAKSCGQFPELRVILRKSVYQSDLALDNDVRVFAASVSIGGGWPNGFVVIGGLPAEQ